jgi:hypothetical protein
MTLPDERYRAVVQTQVFLREILLTPRVPKSIKDGARAMLRHYPTNWDMKQASRQAPDIFAETMEDVQRMIAKYEEGKKNEA